jgi:hypothetical protein
VTSPIDVEMYRHYSYNQVECNSLDSPIDPGDIEHIFPFDILSVQLETGVLSPRGVIAKYVFLSLGHESRGQGLPH